MFGALCPEGSRFEFCSSHHAGTLEKSFLVIACISRCYTLRGCLVVKFDSCNNLLSSVHTLLVNFLQYVRFYINGKYYYYYYYNYAVEFNSCNHLLSSVHAIVVVVIILRSVSLNIKGKYYY